MSLSWWRKSAGPKSQALPLPARRRTRTSTHKPLLEWLEPRLAPATITVTSATDDLATDGTVSLREALASINAGANINPDVAAAGSYGINDTILFNIAGGPGVRTIAVGSTGNGALPTISKPLVLDATSQPGYAGRPLIELNGSAAGSPGVNGLTIMAGGTTVKGLAINRFSGFGVLLTTGGGNLLVNDFLGTDPTGTVAAGNQVGVAVQNSNNNTIGDPPVTGGGNVISGNLVDGIELDGSAGSVAGNVVAGNHIGTDVTGTVALANGNDGVLVTGGATNNTVGGVTAATRNVISANGRNGVDLIGNGTTGNLVEGNFLGTNAAGTTALGNSAQGVDFGVGATLNTVGGTTAAARNLISGNGQNGVFLLSALGSLTTANLIEGNFIGTDVTGNSALANAGDGVNLTGATNNTIGGTTAGAGNVISGNTGNGVSLGILSGTLVLDSTNNLMAGNFIGTNLNGTAAVLNGQNGVLINGASQNTVGGTAAGSQNVISGNRAAGVAMVFGANANLVAGNLVGTDGNGTTPLANGAAGVNVNAGVNNTVGGTTAAARNVISGNQQSGVLLVGAITGPTAAANVVEGNYIGIDIEGIAALANGGAGVELTPGAVNNTIGGTATGAGNVLSGNTLEGLRLSGPTTTGNLAAGNFIGTDATGTVAVANKQAGVFLNGTSGNTIGGAAAGARNVISGNANQGIFASGAANALVAGNFIGTAATGNAALGNKFDGIFLGNSSNNTIGGTGAGAGNVISGNGTSGVSIAGGGSTGDVVQGNLIGLGADGSTTLGNSFSGVYVGDGSIFGPPVPGSASNALIGGNTVAARNVISGNGNFGIDINGAGATGITVQGNFVGTNAAGTAVRPNVFDGIDLRGSAGNDTVGGAAAGAGNLISGNKGSGLNLNMASNNLVQGNLVGTNAAGTAAVANQLAGITVVGIGNTVGGTAAGARNVVSGNGQVGIFIKGSGSSGNLIQGNFIGTDVGGNAALGNGFQGVILVDAPNNTVGGAVAGAGNILSANGNNGVVIAGTNATGDVVQGNLIGVGANGTTPLGNGFSGVYVGDGSGFNPPITGSASNALIGGTTAAARNVIGNNGIQGVQISGIGATGIVVEGNYIGVDATGAAAASNLFTGVRIGGGAANDTVGGTAAGAGNVISANKDFGVHIDATGTTGNLVVGNLIGTNAAGTAALGNVNDGVQLSGGATGNTVGGTTAAARNVVSGNQQNGISAVGSGTSGNLVEGNFVGTDVSGTAGLGNAVNGVLISDVANNTIGGAAAGAGNVLSGNLGSGVALFGTNASGNLVAGNFIGTNAAGTAALGNSIDGVRIDALNGVAGTGAPNNTIGGTQPGMGNLISGNAQVGVGISDAGATGNVVQGNLIGTDATGGLALPNPIGVEIAFAKNATVGGQTPAARNVISGNSQFGVALSNSTGNVVAGNLIGTNAAGTAALGNKQDGVFLVKATGNTLGGTAAGAGNVLSGNGGDGVFLSNAGSTGNLIQGNFIGTNAAGTAALGNAGNGVDLGSPNNTIGGAAAGAGNLISGNTGDGVFFGASGGLVQGNLIGTDVTGTVALGNQHNGVSLNNGGSSGDTIGGTTAAARNVISGNQNSGIASFTATGDLIEGNFIGTDVTGTKALGNQISGVTLNTSSNITIGGTTAAARNVISGNQQDGVRGFFSGTTGILVAGNFVGTDVTGTAALANGQNGVNFEVMASQNTIGGTAAGAGNVLSGNGQNGVLLTDAGTTGNLVQGNLIGTDVTGTKALGNGRNGVSVVAAAGKNTVGGAAAGAGNTIAFNPGAGVVVNAGTGNSILTNSIFNNGDRGIILTNGGNNNQPAPVLTVVMSSANGVVVAGTLAAAAHTTYTLQFFSNPRNFAEGKTFLGTLTVPTDANGQATFSGTLTVPTGASNKPPSSDTLPVQKGASSQGTFSGTLPATIPPGESFFTATATDPSGNTSEFSAVLTPPGLLTATGIAVCAVAGVAFTNVPVAGVTITGQPMPLANYTATINWGDGTAATPGTVVLSGSTLVVRGSHTYTVEGGFTVQVSISDTSGHSASATTTASVFGFVTSLYQEVLNRLPDVQGLAFWLAQERAGVSRTLIAQAFLTSGEHRGIEVDQIYQQILHRPSDAVGRAFWVNVLLAGASENDVAVAFLISPEYTAVHADAASYVTGLYQDVLGRAPDAVGFGFWEQVVASGARSRAAVAYYFLTSGEAYVDAIDEYYRVFLGRSPNALEVQGYLDAILSGQATPASITAVFLGSQEFLDRQNLLACQRMAAT